MTTTRLRCWTTNPGENERIEEESLSALGRRIGLPSLSKARKGRSVFDHQGFRIHVISGSSSTKAEADLGPTEAQMRKLAQEAELKRKVARNLAASCRRYNREEREEGSNRQKGQGIPLLSGLVTHGLGQLWRY